MGLSLRPERLKRYKEIARILFNYGRSDLVSSAGLDAALGAEDSNVPSGAPDPAELPRDLEHLPGRVNKLLDAVANNDLRLHVEVIDEGAVIDGLQKVANRITLGLVLASLIIGAAMLMRVETTFRIFGYPGLAMLFFLVTAGGALWLAFSILTGDQTRRKR